MRILHCKPPSKIKKSLRKKKRIDWQDDLTIEKQVDKITKFFIKTSYPVTEKELVSRFKVPKGSINEIRFKVLESIKFHIIGDEYNQSNFDDTFIQGKEISLEERLEDIRKRKEAQKTDRKNSVIEDGFVYLVVNPAYPEWVKVGHTTDYEKRLQNYQTSSPFADYQMVECKWVENSFQAEQRFLTKAKLVFEVRGEWIKASIDELKKEY